MTLHLDIDRVMDGIEEALWTFEWGRQDGNTIGEVSLDRDDRRLRLWVHPLDNDSPDDEDGRSLIVSREVELGVAPKEQIRALIHFYLCHEADEQMWFGGDRPFYPHNPDGSLRDV